MSSVENLMAPHIHGTCAYCAVKKTTWFCAIVDHVICCCSVLHAGYDKAAGFYWLTKQSADTWCMVIRNKYGTTVNITQNRPLMGSHNAAPLHSREKLLFRT